MRGRRRLSDAGIFVALDRGFFKAEGSMSSLSPSKNGPQIIPSLGPARRRERGDGQPSLSTRSRAESTSARDRQGQVSKGFGWAALVVRSDLAATIKDYKDLQGRRIALRPGASRFPRSSQKRWTMGGLTVDDVDLAEIGFAEMMPAIRQTGRSMWPWSSEPFTALLPSADRGALARC